MKHNQYEVMTISLAKELMAKKRAAKIAARRECNQRVMLADCKARTRIGSGNQMALALKEAVAKIDVLKLKDILLQKKERMLAQMQALLACMKEGKKNTNKCFWILQKHFGFSFHNLFKQVIAEYHLLKSELSKIELNLAFVKVLETV